MGAFIEQLGQQAAGSAVGGILGIATGAINDKRQIRQQRKLQQMQMQGQKEMVNFNNQKALEMWEKTGYGATVNQIKEAGLNPALIYGMGGAGGQTTGAEGAGPQGANAPVGGQEITQMTGMGIQMGMMEAQKKLLESQANLNNVEASKKAGVDTDLANTQIENLQQGIKNQQAQERLTNIQANLSSVAEKMANETYKEQVDIIVANAAAAKTTYDKLAQEYDLDRAQYHTKLKMLEAQAIKATLEVALTEAGIDKTKWDTKATQAQIDKWATEIAQANRGLDQKDLEIAIRKFEAEVKANFPGIGNIIGNLVQDGIEEIRKKLGTQGQNREMTVPKP